jgi:hypothetical protein
MCYDNKNIIEGESMNNKILELKTPDGKTFLAKIIDKKPNDNWGGAREGAGREALGRKQRNFRLTEDEYTKVKDFVKMIREEK